MTTTRTSRRRSGAGSSSLASGASSAAPGWTSTARPSTSGRTCGPRRSAGSGVEPRLTATVGGDDTMTAGIEEPVRGSEPVVRQESGPERGQRDGAVIDVRNLWKVFGRKAGDVPNSPELARLSRKDLKSKTGCV